LLHYVIVMRMPLSSLQEGQEGVVVSIMPPAPGNSMESGWGIPFFGRRFRWRWGRRGRGAGYGAMKRLADLGIVIGSRIKVVKKAPFGGPIEIEIGGSRFIIGRQLADRVIVEV